MIKGWIKNDRRSNQGGKLEKVRNLQDDTWQVYETDTDETQYQGSLADCEAYIRLHRDRLLG